MVLALLVTIILNNNLVAIENRLSVSEGFENAYTKTVEVSPPKMRHPKAKARSRSKPKKQPFPERNNPDTENTLFEDEDNFASDEEDMEDAHDMLFDLHEDTPSSNGSSNGELESELLRVEAGVQRCLELLESQRE